MDDTKKQQRTYKFYLTENEVKFITQSLQGKWEFYEKIKEDCDENLSELIKHLVEETLQPIILEVNDCKDYLRNILESTEPDFQEDDREF